MMPITTVQNSFMLWSHYGPILCYLDFSEWGGGWGDTVWIVDYGYVVLPYDEAKAKVKAKAEAEA